MTFPDSADILTPFNSHIDSDHNSAVDVWDGHHPQTSFYDEPQHHSHYDTQHPSKIPALPKQSNNKKILKGSLLLLELCTATSPTSLLLTLLGELAS